MEYLAKGGTRNFQCIFNNNGGQNVVHKIHIRKMSIFQKISRPTNQELPQYIEIIVFLRVFYHYLVYIALEN